MLRVLLPEAYFLLVHLIVDVENAFLNFVVNFSRRVDERLLHVGGRLCRRLHEDEAVLAGESLTLFSFYVASSLKITEGKDRISALWPDLSKFRQFGKTLQVFGNFSTVYFLFGKMMDLLWQIWNIVWIIFIVAKGQISKNNLTNWSHWISVDSFFFRHRGNQRAIIIWGSNPVRLVSCFTSNDSTASLHTKKQFLF